MADAPGEVTRLLKNLRAGDREGESQLISLVYRELHAIAESVMRSERGDHTLQPTALLHEAYLRLLSGQKQDWQDRAHFFAVASRIMRQILVDYARAFRAAKRGGKLRRVDLEEPPELNEGNYEVMLFMDQALDRLASWDPRQSRVVELRFFVGLSEKEIAEVLEISPRTVRREWQIARAWLYSELKAKESSQSV